MYRYTDLTYRGMIQPVFAEGAVKHQRTISVISDCSKLCFGYNWREGQKVLMVMRVLTTVKGLVLVGCA